MSPVLSIIILTWNGEEDVYTLIQSLRDFPPQASCHLIFVDNGSDDGTISHILNLAKNPGPYQVTTLFHSENLGYTQGNNSALPYLKGKYSMFLNQDIVIQPGTLDALTDVLENDVQEKYGAVAPQLRYPDGSIQSSVRSLPTPRTMLGHYMKGKWHDDFSHTVSQHCEQPMAAALMVRTQILQDIQGFDPDPRMWLFFNDVDLCHTILDRGYQIYFVASHFFIHGHGKSTEKIPTTQKLGLWHKGMIYYFQKWYLPRIDQKCLLYLGALISFFALGIRNHIRNLIS